MNKEKLRLKEKRKFKKDIIDGFHEEFININEVMIERRVFWFEER